jgi:catechol 2,3-dioxygenase-like lactoylglutathione lyase family enzyme
MIDVNVLFVGIPVTDFDAARAWYSKMFGRAEDVVASKDEVIWRFAAAAWLYIVKDEQRAGYALAALATWQRPSPSFGELCSDTVVNSPILGRAVGVSAAAR